MWFKPLALQLSYDESPRCGGVFWGNEELALIYESEWKTRRSVVSTFAPGKPEQGLQVLFDRYRSITLHACMLAAYVLHAGLFILHRVAAILLCTVRLP